MRCRRSVAETQFNRILSKGVGSNPTLVKQAAQVAGAFITDEGRGIVIATHDLAQAQRWDAVLCLNKTQIAFGAPDQVLDRQVLEETYAGAIVEIPGSDRVGVLPAHHH